MIAVIDYDAGNIRSVEKALLSLEQDVRITGDAKEILSADKVILPGVGAFGDAMENIRKSGLDKVDPPCGGGQKAFPRDLSWLTAFVRTQRGSAGSGRAGHP